MSSRVPPSVIPPGLWWSWDRGALAPLSMGWRTQPFGLETQQGPDALQLLTIDTESPEPRVLRVQYDGRDWEEQTFQGVRVELLCKLDASSTRQRILVPWQGIAIPLPAGTGRVILSREPGLVGGNVTPATRTVASISVSRHAIGWSYRQPEPTLVSQGDDGWWLLPPLGTTRLLPPPFATGAIVMIHQDPGGASANVVFTGLTGGISILASPGQYIDIPIPLPGWIEAANPDAANNARFTIEWKVSS